MTENHKLSLEHVEYKVNQSPLTGTGIVVKTLQDGTELSVGDLIVATEPEMKTGNTLNDIITIHPPQDIIGILVLVLDQGICIISKDYWMQVNRTMLQQWDWRLVSKFE